MIDIVENEITHIEKILSEDKEFDNYCKNVCEKINKQYPNPNDIRFESFEEGLAYMLSNMKDNQMSKEDWKRFAEI